MYPYTLSVHQLYVLDEVTQWLLFSMYGFRLANSRSKFIHICGKSPGDKRNEGILCIPLCDTLQPELIRLSAN